MKSFLILASVILVTAIILAGCTAQKPASPATPLPAQVATTTAPRSVTDPALNGTWDFMGAYLSGGSMPAYTNDRITIAFVMDGTLTGFAGCNNYFGSYLLNRMTTEFGNGISIGSVGSTMMYCENMSTETSYLAGIQHAATYSIAGNKLLLRLDNGDELSYVKAP